MAFSNFKNINQVIQKYPLKIEWQQCLPDTPLELPDWFMDNLHFSLNKPGIQNEAFLCESIIFPFLQLAWKPHNKLALWSHWALNYDDELFGEPDYLISVWRDDIIDKLVNTPLLAVSEAKKQDFEGGWGQSLAEMLAYQKLNQNDNIKIYSIVSTGIFL